jgi:hypothetical protein
MAFNLEDYEDVATLNKWFIQNFPLGRSDISVISHDPEKGYILVQATLWRDSKDTAPAVSNTDSAAAIHNSAIYWSNLNRDPFYNSTSSREGI